MRYWLIVAAVCVVVASCAKEDDDNNSSAEGGNVIVPQTVSYDESVDLGLSVMWAKTNIGADTEVDPGLYFAWGETVTKDTFSLATYEHYDTAYVYLGKNISGTEYDVARMEWGGLWRMPTTAEWSELVDSCSWKWCWDFKYFGYKVTARNGNSIFLPAAGAYRKGEDPKTLYDLQAKGYYWTSTFFYKGFGSAVYFNSNKPDKNSSYEVYKGLSVRPVYQKK